MQDRGGGWARSPFLRPMNDALPPKQIPQLCLRWCFLMLQFVARRYREDILQNLTFLPWQNTTKDILKYLTWVWYDIQKHDHHEIFRSKNDATCGNKKTPGPGITPPSVSPKRNDPTPTTPPSTDPREQCQRPKSTFFCFAWRGNEENFPMSQGMSYPPGFFNISHQGKRKVIF